MKAKSSRIRSAIVRVSSSEQLPWWWKEIHLDPELCDIDFVRVKFRGKANKQITALEAPLVFVLLLKELFAMRRRYEYVFTMECDFVGLGFAFWQSLLFMQRPRHVIVQFIMREKSTRLASRLKYILMSFMFRSVHRVVCSSRSEMEYYQNVFGWPTGKTKFVPIPTSPDWLEAPNPEADGNYLVAAGRVFRDYRTVIEAIRQTPFRLIIIGDVGIRARFESDDQVEVLEDVPHAEFSKLMRYAAAVIVPLFDRKISAGQLVLLQAMAMGKLVIATRTAGTEDYVSHMSDGILVEPGDVADMRRAIGQVSSHDLRRELGARARDRMAKWHMPRHYSAAVRRAISEQQ